MNQRSSIYWKNPKTAERVKQLAGERSVSAYLSELVTQEWQKLNPEPPIRATCPTCKQETTFVFVAYWGEQSDLYRCSNCQKVAQYDFIMGNGHKADETEKMEAVQ